MAQLEFNSELDIPLGLLLGARFTGYDELGNPVYRGSDGRSYAVPGGTPTNPTAGMGEAKDTGKKRGSVIKGLARDPIEGMKSIAKAIYGGTVDAVAMPGRAAAGEIVTMGDILNTAGMVQLGGAAMPAPKGALRSGAMRDTTMPSRSVESIDDIRAMLSNDEDVFVRWSAGPKYDMVPGAKSKDYVNGSTHDGLSAVELRKDMSDQDIFKMVRDYSFLRGEKANAPYFYSGKSVGVDSDGTPSIVPSKFLGAGSNRLMSFIDDEVNLERISLIGQEKSALAAMESPDYGKGPWLPYWTPEKLSKIKNRLDEIGR